MKPSEFYTGLVADMYDALVLRWYSQQQFRHLLDTAGLDTVHVAGEDGTPAGEDAPAFVFIASRPSASA